MRYTIAIGIIGLVSGMLAACSLQPRGGKLAAVAMRSATSPDIGQPLRVHFPTNSDRVIRRERRLVDQEADWLIHAPTVQILLEGHADARGAREWNLHLGDRRARRVAAMLIDRGVAARQIVGVISQGESVPLVRGNGPTAWIANRRVEFIAP